MSSDESSKAKVNTKPSDVSNALKDLSPNLNFVEYLKRFFYQIIGIYFPAAILFSYIFLFWYVGFDQDPVSYYSGFHNTAWPDFLDTRLLDLEQNIGNQNQVIQLILFVVAIVILGEGINAMTSRFTMLSPVVTSKKERILFSVWNRSIPGIYNHAKWPIWLNETSFPVSFSQFDRYYVSALEQDKRTLAGKIGWVSFYRNMVAVFVIVLSLQILLTIITYASLNKIYGYERYIIGIASIAIIFLFFGYRAQIKSNESIFWDAYKRYQLRKNLEIRYGDLTLAFGIKDENKTRALEYMVDRWFLGVDNTIQTISRYFLTRLEQKYENIFKCKSMCTPSNDSKQSKSNNQLQVDLISVEKKIKRILTDCYRDWNRGAYERVIKDALDAFEEINKFRRKHLSDLRRLCNESSVANDRSHKPLLSKNVLNWDEDIPTEDEWKTISGFYILENSLRTDAAFVEILTNVTKWGWTIQDDKELINKNEGNTNNQHISKPINPEKTKDDLSIEDDELPFYYIPNPKRNKIHYDQMGNIVRETSDPYQVAYFQIMSTLEKFNDLTIKNRLNDDQKMICFERLREIYRLFGGYNYADAFANAKKFFDNIYQNGSLDVLLKSEGTKSNRSRFVGGIPKEVSHIPEKALVTKIVNTTAFKLNNIYHINENSRVEEVCSHLDPYLCSHVQEARTIYLKGQWNVESVNADHNLIPTEINLKIKWKAPVEISRQ